MITGELTFPGRTYEELKQAVDTSIESLGGDRTWSGDLVEVRLSRKLRTWYALVLTAKLNGSTVVASTRLARGDTWAIDAGLSREILLAFFNRLAYELDGGPLNRWKANVRWRSWVIPVGIWTQLPFVLGFAFGLPPFAGEEGTWSPEVGFVTQTRPHLCFMYVLFVLIPVTLLSMFVGLRIGGLLWAWIIGLVSFALATIFMRLTLVSSPVTPGYQQLFNRRTGQPNLIGFVLFLGVGTCLALGLVGLIAYATQ